jgi:hypothetical protein
MKTTLSLVLFLLSYGVASAQVKTEANKALQQKHLKATANNPLYVIFANEKEIFRSSDTSTLHTIIPQDIESVNVLKNNTATQKYGNKAIYGVVEIFMKDGKFPSGYKKPDSELKKD